MREVLVRIMVIEFVGRRNQTYLEYWKYLPVRHVLDVMHIEKNVCDSIVAIVSLVHCDSILHLNLMIVIP
ncbi:unnamed protein product [Prunus armeniaca]